MADLRARFGARVRELRLARRLTQEGLAERAGLSYKFLGEVERGIGNPTLDTLQRISEALGIQIVDLFPSAPPSRRSPGYAISEADFQVMRDALESLGELVADVDTTYRRRRGRKRKTLQPRR